MKRFAVVAAFCAAYSTAMASTSSAAAHRAGALGLRRLRTGYALTALAVIPGVLLRFMTSLFARQVMQLTIGLLALALYVFYLMLLHRTTRVLEDQPYWWGRYSAWGIVWRQMIPVYNIYALWHWTRTAGEYIEWRLGQESKAGELAFWCVVPGLLLFFSDTIPLAIAMMGMLLVLVGFELLYGPLQRALARAAPAEPSSAHEVTGPIPV